MVWGHRWGTGNSSIVYVAYGYNGKVYVCYVGNWEYVIYTTCRAKRLTHK